MEEIIKYIIENYDKVIGSGGVLSGGAYWIYRTLKKKKETTRSTNDQSNSFVSNEKKLLSDYLVDIIKRSSTIKFGGPSSLDRSINSKDESTITLDQLWIPLKIADSNQRKGKQGTHDNMTESDDNITIMSFYENKIDSAIILGDPGSGKSTTLANYALHSARKYRKDKLNKIPIWVNLPDITSFSSSNQIEIISSAIPELDLARKRNGEHGFSELKSTLSDHLLEGNALILFDGLDEVKEFNIDIVRDVISAIKSINSDNRIFVSCRVFDYRQNSPNRKIPIERELELLPYDFEQQKDYVTKWYQASIDSGKFTSAQAIGLKEALIIELKQDSIKEISSSPLLLSLLTIIHSEEAKLPDTRAVLCDKAISYMLADSAKWRERQAGVAVIASPPVMSVATQLAYSIHSKEELENSSDTFSKSEIIKITENICDEISKAETGRKPPSQRDLADRFLNSHGLLVNAGKDLYKFSHRSFQEFLAGQYFIVGAKLEDALKLSESSHWNEAFKLMASFSGHDGSNLFFILQFIKALYNKSTENSIILAGEMLVEIGKRRLALHKHSKIFNTESGLWNEITLASIRILESNKEDLILRDRTSHLLSHLGDPRFENIFPFLISYPQAEIKVGSTKPNSKEVNFSGGFVGEPRTIEFNEFSVGKYLVTNSDFQKFMDDDGYTTLSYWESNFAKGWLTGEHAISEKIRNHWLSTAHEHHTKELRDGEINEKYIEDESRTRTQPRQEPFYWNDRRFNQKNQPVVGINFWEAKAYCKWLTAKCKSLNLIKANMVFDLPSEFEWERVCRSISDDRLYPWGNSWEEGKAHVSTNFLNMRRPCSVGVYPQASENTPCDIIGNVWEWTNNLFLPYDEKFDNKRLNDDSLEERVVRGSSWYNTSILAAISIRAVDRSYNIFYDVGFRVILIDRNTVRI